MDARHDSISVAFGAARAQQRIGYGVNERAPAPVFVAGFVHERGTRLDEPVAGGAVVAEHGNGDVDVADDRGAAEQRRPLARDFGNDRDRVVRRARTGRAATDPWPAGRACTRSRRSDRGGRTVRPRAGPDRGRRDDPTASRLRAAAPRPAAGSAAGGGGRSDRRERKDRSARTPTIPGPRCRPECLPEPAAEGRARRSRQVARSRSAAPGGATRHGGTTNAEATVASTTTEAKIARR